MEFPLSGGKERATVITVIIYFTVENEPGLLQVEII
jgi:hypothetical protein